MPMDEKKWQDAREYDPQKMAVARKALEDIRGGKKVIQAIHDNPIPTGGYIAKHHLVAAYRELVESGVSRVDPANSVFTHQDNCVCVENEITANRGSPGEDVTSDLRVSFGFDEDPDTRRSKKRLHEAPGPGGIPRAFEDPGMRRDAHEFVDDAPGEIPRRGLVSPPLQEIPAPPVLRRTGVCGMQQHIGVDYEHQRRSMTS